MNVRTRVSLSAGADTGQSPPARLDMHCPYCNSLMTLDGARSLRCNASGAVFSEHMSRVLVETYPERKFLAGGPVELAEKGWFCPGCGVALEGYRCSCCGKSLEALVYRIAEFNPHTA